MDIDIIRFHATIFYCFVLSWDFEEEYRFWGGGGGVGGSIEVDVVVALKDKVREHSHNYNYYTVPSRKRAHYGISAHSPLWDQSPAKV